ncbi:hypothetical protein D3C81_2162490 [compost metagenome]
MTFTDNHQMQARTLDQRHGKRLNQAGKSLVTHQTPHCAHHRSVIGGQVQTGSGLFARQQAGAKVDGVKRTAQRDDRQMQSAGQ